MVRIAGSAGWALLEPIIATHHRKRPPTMRGAAFFAWVSTNEMHREEC